MQSITEQILARALVILTGTTAAGAHVWRGREDAFGADEIPGINISRVGTVNQVETMEADQVSTAFDLSIYQSAADPAAAETAADALHLEAHALLKADAILGALGRYTLRCAGTESESVARDFSFYRLTARYEIDAWVLQTDLATPV